MRSLWAGLAVLLAFSPCDASHAQSAKELLGVLKKSTQQRRTNEILEELAIPDTPPAEASITPAFGKYLMMDYGDATITYRIHEDGTAQAVRGAPLGGVFIGTWRQDGGQTCFSFSAGTENCGTTSFDGLRASMFGPQGETAHGWLYEVSPPPRLGLTSSPLDEDFCQTLKEVADSGARDKFESLIDQSREQGQTNDFSEPYYFANRRLFDQDCRIENGILGIEYNCEQIFDPGDAKNADGRYQSVIQQTELCLSDRLASAEPDYPQQYQIIAAMQDKGERESRFKLNDGGEITVSLQSRSICSDVLSCENKYGIWFSLTRRQ